MDPYFWNILKNTVVLNLWMLVLYFPTPIILALLINEVKNKHFKKMAQTISYMPYFLSTVVVCGFITTILSNDGLINQVVSSLGLEKDTVPYGAGLVPPDLCHFGNLAAVWMGVPSFIWQPWQAWFTAL